MNDVHARGVEFRTVATGISHHKIGDVPRDFVTGQNSSAYLVMVPKALNPLIDIGQTDLPRHLPPAM